MKIKIITNILAEELTREVNKFIKGKKVLHINYSNYIDKSYEKTYTTVEKITTNDIEHVATIIYEE